MYNFQYANPTRVCFGEGQIAKLPELIPAGSRLLVLYGGGSIKQNGVYEQLTQALAGREWLEFPGIGANPQYDQLMEAVALVKRERIDFLLAVGGGSVVDGTKFVAAAACFEGDDPWEILRDKAPIKGALPLGCVLTLPATGSESNPAAVVSRGEAKLSFMNPLVQPVFAVLDPTTTYSLPPRQVGNGVVDAFVHIIEQYLTFPVGGEVQDRLAEGLLQVLVDNGPRALAEPTNYQVRANLMWRPAWRSTASSVAACPRTGPPTPSVTSSPPCTGWIMPRAWRWCCPPCCASNRPRSRRSWPSSPSEYGTPAARTRRCGSRRPSSAPSSSSSRWGWVPASPTMAWMRAASRGSVPTSSCSA